MIESVADIAELDYPGPDTTITDADLADWIEQQQTLPLPDDDYPYECSPRTSPTEHLADWPHFPHPAHPAELSAPLASLSCGSFGIRRCAGAVAHFAGSRRPGRRITRCATGRATARLMVS